MESRRTGWFLNLLRKLWVLPVRVVDAVVLAACGAVRIVALTAGVAIRTVMVVAALPVLLPLLLLDGAFKGFQKIKQQHSLVDAAYAQSRLQMMSGSGTKKVVQADSAAVPQADAAASARAVPLEVLQEAVAVPNVANTAIQEVLRDAGATVISSSH